MNNIGRTALIIIMIYCVICTIVFHFRLYREPIIEYIEVDISKDKYERLSDSLDIVIDGLTIQIDSLRNKDKEIEIRYETVYSHIRTLPIDSLAMFISDKIYNRE